MRAGSADEAMRAIDAIREGGVSVLEITMTVPGALGVIEQVAARYSAEAVIGAGTVLDAETARACILNGAQFIVSPSLNLDTIGCCRRYGVAVLPGALTPTEVVQAWTAGADFVKVFPAGAPTGGVSLKTAADFIKAGASALGVGADLVDIKAIREDQDSVITERARQFVEIVRKARNSG